MKWKLLMRNLSVSSPAMTIRSRLPWSVRLLLVFVGLAMAAAAGVAIYEYGRGLGGPDRRELADEVDRLRAQLRESESERSRLTATATAFEAQLKVERSAQAQLLKQSTQLEAEVGRLREDLAFFESLLPTKANASGIQIRSFRAHSDGEPDTLRYRLLVQQAGKPERDFVGQVQLQVNMMREGRAITMQVPDPVLSESKRPFELAFRHYQRVEGALRLPEGAVARSIIVRIVAAGQTLTQQTFQL